MAHTRNRPGLNWLTETKYWLEHEEELNTNLMLGLKYVRYMKDNNLSEKEAADHYGITETEFHKIIHGQIPPKDLKI